VAQQQTAAAGSAREAAAQTWRELGALAYTRSTEAALAAYRQAAALAPGDAWTWIEISRLERQAGHLERAEEAARRAREAAAAAGGERGEAVAEHELGVIHMARGDLAAAEAAFMAYQRTSEKLAGSDPGERGLAAGPVGELGEARRRAGGTGGSGGGASGL
jgi:tetratricopeptide (TPR) repeat protein